MLALLTDEQVMLQDMARDLGRKLGLANPADLDTADPGACWQELAQAGLLGFRLRDEAGRPAASGVEVAVVSEAIGAALVPVAYVISGVLVPELLAAAAAPASLQADVAEGRTIIGLAMRPDLTGVAATDGPVRRRADRHARVTGRSSRGPPGQASSSASRPMIDNLERLDSVELSIPLYRLRDTGRSSRRPGWAARRRRTRWTGGWPWGSARWRPR